MAEIIAIINQKGGTGKTTTTVNLGACLAELGKRVLIVDLDPQSNASIHLVGKQKAEELWLNRRSIYDVLVKGAKAQDAVVETVAPELKLLPSHIKLSGADMELAPVFCRERILRDQLKPLAAEYDFILIDCLPSLGVLTLNALSCANSYIVTLQAEYLALEGMTQLLNTAYLVKNRMGWSIELLGVLLTFYHPTKLISRQIEESAKEFFRERLFQTRIREDVRLSEAPSHGQPITLYRPKSRGAEDYRKLAEEVKTHVQNRVGRESLIAN